jgi:tetratricopeptide (TPR) repeat protein
VSTDRSSSVRLAAYASGYPARDVARLLGLTVAQIAALVRAGCVNPRRGPRRELRFSFQDLVLLRAAKDLITRMPARRVHRALLKLKEQLPAGRQLAALRLTAEGEDIVVRDGASAWNPESGQAVLNLDIASLATAVAPLARRAADLASESEGMDAEDWFRLGCDLEPVEPERALESYRRALELAPDHADAHLNLGCLLHEEGRFTEAEAHYRDALAARPDDATASFNLGVALEDLRHPHAAAAAYQRALEVDAEYADAHFNLARLWERLGEPHKALRHLHAFRRLSGAAPANG